MLHVRRAPDDVVRNTEATDRQRFFAAVQRVLLVSRGRARASDLVRVFMTRARRLLQRSVFTVCDAVLQLEGAHLL